MASDSSSESLSERSAAKSASAPGSGLGSTKGVTQGSTPRLAPESAPGTATAAILEMSRSLARPWLVLSGFAGILILRSVAPVAGALFMRNSLDFIAAQDSSRFFMNGLLLVMCYVVETFSASASVYLRVSAEESFSGSSRMRFVKRAMAMPFDRYESLSRGDLVSRVTADINQSSRVLSVTYFILQNVIKAAAAIATLIYMSWRLGLMTLAVMGLSVWLNARLNRPIAQAGKAYQESLGGISAYALNAIEGRMVIKAFMAEDRIERGFSEKTRGARDKALTVARRVGLVILASIGSALGTLIIFFGYGAYLAVSGKMSFGSMLAALFLTDYITPLGRLGGLWADLQRSVGAYERVKEVMEAEEDRDLPVPEGVADPGMAARRAGARGVADRRAQAPELPVYGDSRDHHVSITLSVQNLSYEYVPGTRVLDGVSFEVKRGQKVAIVGRSGCGKSTLMKILAGLYRPEPGTVFVNGLDMAYRRLEEGREAVTYVPQEPFLFAGSVADNLALGLPGGQGGPGRQGDLKTARGADGTEDSLEDCLEDCSEECPKERLQDCPEMWPELRRCLELGDALEFVLSAEKGLETQVGERGSLLSGGQRQRLCLARGFLRGTPVLLLDEPTSSVHREAEARILAGLLPQPDLTCLVVTHRLDVAEAADLLLVMDRGCLAEAGSHEELLNNKGLYWSMFTGEVSLSGTTSPEAEDAGPPDSGSAQWSGAGASRLRSEVPERGGGAR